jgi:hypothetical protein
MNPILLPHHFFGKIQDREKKNSTGEKEEVEGTTVVVLDKVEGVTTMVVLDGVKGITTMAVPDGVKGRTTVVVLDGVEGMMTYGRFNT